MSTKVPETSSNEPSPSAGETSVKLDRELQTRLDKLDQALSKTRAEEKEAAFGRDGPKGRSEAWAKAFRYATDFIAGIVAGGLIGFGLDWVFGSKPWCLFVGVLLGFAAGTLNILRADAEIRKTKLGADSAENDPGS